MPGLHIGGRPERRLQSIRSRLRLLAGTHVPTLTLLVICAGAIEIYTVAEVVAVGYRGDVTVGLMEGEDC